MKRILLFLCAVGLATAISGLASAQSVDPLPSWNESASKRAIVQFVTEVSTAGTSGFVPPPERVAVFDNDGTLWAEQPMYFQLAFALDRVKAMAPGHPEWKQEQPFKAVLEGDLETALSGGEHALLELIIATHANMTTEEFSGVVTDWLATATHPVTGRAYTDMVYQPMLELLAYLRAHDFKTYIVSGGGREFMRPFAEDVYGVPPEQVVGSSIKTKFDMRDGAPVLVRMAEMNFIDDKEGKPVGIHEHIGRRPIAAFGNSDGDLQMLQWTTGGDGARFALLVQHTDEDREWAYDRASSIGRLDKALDEAGAKGWTVVDMKSDWKRVFSPPGGDATARPNPSESQLLELLDEFGEAWNRHDLDALMSMMTEDGVYESSGGESAEGTRHVGQAAVRAAFASIFEAFPDAHWGDARHIVSGDRGFSEWTFTGTLADGRRVEVKGCDLFTFRDGKIAVKNSLRKNRPPFAP